MLLVRVGGGNELMKFAVDPNTAQLAEAVEDGEKLQMELIFSGSQARVAAKIEHEHIRGKALGVRLISASFMMQDLGQSPRGCGRPPSGHSVQGRAHLSPSTSGVPVVEGPWALAS